MATVINIHHAKTQLSKLLKRVEAGEEIIIGRAGRPIARLTPYEGNTLEPRQPGGWEGKVAIAEEFDTLPDELIDAFYTSRLFPDNEA